VPKLSSALSDTHENIRQSASNSLSMIGSSIKNPEISEIVDILIESLSNPF
jgi:HEAT repeat protein